MARSYLFTSESVSPGHPDKVADQIADAVLDEALLKDPGAHVACEVLVAPGRIVLAGEFKTRFPGVELREAAPGLARKVLEEIGYGDPRWGFDIKACDIQAYFGAQSAQIDAGVSLEDGEIGAGDQGLMFGFACDETPELMPLPITLARRLVQRQADARKRGELPWLGPDAKSQVTVRYEGGKPLGVETVVLSTQHSSGVPTDEVHEAVRSQIVEPVIPEVLRLPGFSCLINPAGRFEQGGPAADTGVTGRKIIADTYGGSCPHGGGAFSGKDPTKVDRSGALAARYIAKNVVAAGLARRCTVQLAYAIGRTEPVSIHVNLHGTGTVDEGILEAAIVPIFPVTPRAILEQLDLRRPIWRLTSHYGPFASLARDLPWEQTDRTSVLNASIA